jgi:hypothetical protein
MYNDLVNIISLISYRKQKAKFPNNLLLTKTAEHAEVRKVRFNQSILAALGSFAVPC